MTDLSLDQMLACVRAAHAMLTTIEQTSDSIEICEEHWSDACHAHCPTVSASDLAELAEIILEGIGQGVRRDCLIFDLAHALSHVANGDCDDHRRVH